MDVRTGPFSSAARLVSTIRHLEGLGCWNTAEVMILWAWTNGIVNTANHDAYKHVEQEIHKCYRLRGMEHLVALSRHIKSNPSGNPMSPDALGRNNQVTSRRIEGVRRPVRIQMDGGEFCGIGRMDVYGISQTCQLKWLYQLFGYDPTTSEVVGSNSEREVLVRSVVPVHFLDFVCDYP